MKNKTIWRVLQVVVWIAGAAIFFSLLFFPAIGILVMWNILIPLAPALIALAAGIWRNVCPMATTVLLPRHLGLSLKKTMPVEVQAKLSVVSVILLYVIVPLRHPLFNTNAAATAILLFILLLAGLIMGFIYEWKSGWCSSVCPVHPVEKLYGNNVILSVPNAHCSSCMNCMIPCPDATPNISPLSAKKTLYHKVGGVLITGGLPGFIWGWFKVPDTSAVSSFSGIISVYKYPLAGLLITLLSYLLIRKLFKGVNQQFIIKCFAAAAISCYYWFRLPELFGFGEYPGDGLLVDLTSVVSSGLINIVRISVVLFFVWWMVLKSSKGRNWLIRPSFSKQILSRQ